MPSKPASRLRIPLELAMTPIGDRAFRALRCPEVTADAMSGPQWVYAIARGLGPNPVRDVVFVQDMENYAFELVSAWGTKPDLDGVLQAVLEKSADEAGIDPFCLKRSQRKSLDEQRDNYTSEKVLDAVEKQSRRDLQEQRRIRDELTADDNVTEPIKVRVSEPETRRMLPGIPRP